MRGIAHNPPGRATRPATPTQQRLNCSGCIGSWADVEYRLVPESDSEVVSEHLSGCPDCRLFTEQIDTSRQILTAVTSAEFADIVGRAHSELADGLTESSFKALRRIADALDPDNADDLLQQVLVDAIGMNTEVTSVDLAAALIHAANESGSEATSSLYDDADASSQAYDTDSETAELFYPQFYDDGLDAGRFIDSPNVWGNVLPITPHDQVAAAELYELVDAAVDQLPALPRRLITLVDLNGMEIEHAARIVRVPRRRATRALNVARIHLRGALDRYLSTRVSDPTAGPSPRDGRAAPTGLHRTRANPDRTT